MWPIILFFSVMLLLFAFMLLWVQHKWRQSDRSRVIDAAEIGESVRVDLKVIEAIPALAPSVADVKWSKLKKIANGRTDVGGVVVFGPRNLTWAPNELSRSMGVSPWRLAWADVAGASVRTATTTMSAALVLSLTAGTTLELVGVDPARTLEALRRREEGEPEDAASESEQA